MTLLKKKLPEKFIYNERKIMVTIKVSLFLNIKLFLSSVIEDVFVIF